MKSRLAHFAWLYCFLTVALVAGIQAAFSTPTDASLQVPEPSPPPQYKNLPEDWQIPTGDLNEIYRQSEFANESLALLPREFAEQIALESAREKAEALRLQKEREAERVRKELEMRDAERIALQRKLEATYQLNEKLERVSRRAMHSSVWKRE